EFLDPGSPGRVKLAVVTGAGGIGKSTLAVHAAHRIKALFPDGQLYVNLRGAGTSPLAPKEVLGRFLRDFGLAPAALPEEEEGRPALYRTVRAERRVLIVLDDARDAAQIRPLIPSGPGSALVATSRNRLVELDGARRWDLDVLDSADAGALFA